nr:TetR/AcrR family transcriptional regulator [Nocardia transvalensis]
METARMLFAEKGSQVQLPEVARAAGVGIGTVYRHFPTLADLIDAAAEQRFDEIEAFARGLVEAEPGQGLVRYLHHVGETLAADSGLSAAIESARQSPGSAPRGASLTRLAAVLDDIIAGDRAAGTLREDCTTADVYLLVGAISATVRTGSGDWRRLVDLALDGLRPRS